MFNENTAKASLINYYECFLEVLLRLWMSESVCECVQAKNPTVIYLKWSRGICSILHWHIAYETWTEARNTTQHELRLEMHWEWIKKQLKIWNYNSQAKYDLQIHKSSHMHVIFRCFLTAYNGQLRPLETFFWLWCDAGIMPGIQDGRGRPVEVDSN